jgi:hypothetical protein
MAQTFSADEFLALKRYVSDLRSNLEEISQLLTARLGADNNLSQDAAGALNLIESLNSGLLKQSARFSQKSAAGESAA